jgi:hypothetical protein
MTKAIAIRNRENIRTSFGKWKFIVYTPLEVDGLHDKRLAE